MSTNEYRLTKHTCSGTQSVPHARILTRYPPPAKQLRPSTNVRLKFQVICPEVGCVVQNADACYGRGNTFWQKKTSERRGSLTQNRRNFILCYRCEKALPTELYLVGVKNRSISQPRVILVTLYPPLSEHRDLWGVGSVHGRTLTDPLRFNTWGTREVRL